MAINLMVAILIFSIVPIICTLNVKADSYKVKIDSKNFPDSNFRLYVQNNFNPVKEKDGYYLYQEQLNAVTKIVVNGTSQTTYNNLTGINFFPNLEELYCTNNPNLTVLSLTQTPKLRILHCSDTGISYLNLNYNTELTNLWCQNCNLSSLDVSKNKKIVELNCRNNKISVLSLANNTELATLNCHQNKISTLDLSKNTKLDYLACYDNNLSSLDLSNNKLLTDVYCSNNALSSLNVSNLSKLERLDFSNNKISSINLDTNVKLVGLYCSNNSLTRLSTRNCTNLAELYCYGNKFKDISITKNGVLDKKVNSSSIKKETITVNKLSTTQYTDDNNATFLWVDEGTNIYTLSSNVSNTEVNEEEVRKFVTRLYYTLLDREPENDTVVDEWTRKLVNKEVDGAGIAQGFVLSDELNNQKLSHEVFVTRLYETFLGREPDQQGLNNWVNELKNGTSKKYVLAGFVNSPEYEKICKEIGINRGTINAKKDTPAPQKSNKLKVDASNANQAQVTDFTKRLYLKILGREGEADGIDYWTYAIMNSKDKNGREYDAGTVVSVGFFMSDEYALKNTTNEQFLKDCYAAFFNREPDQAGYYDWLTQLNNKTITRKEVIERGFGTSEEFKLLLNSYGFKVLN